MFVYDKLLINTQGSSFCLLFNIKAFFRGWDVRFIYNPHSKKYTSNSRKYSLSFYHERVANRTYSGGFQNRARKLGAVYFLPLIAFEPNDVVVDCGANVGDLKLYFSENNIPIEYIGIEPSPLEYECLKDNVSPSRTLNIGLWNYDGEFDFFVSSQRADSSLIAPLVFDKTIQVPTMRLDGILREKRIKLLKIEAEGGEPEVVYGCEKILNNIEYISADLGYERGVEQSSTLVPVINYLITHGFDLIEITPQGRIVALLRNTRI